MSPRDKPLVWLHGVVKTPPLSVEARRNAGFLLRQLQAGERLSMPDSRPMPSVGARCHELRVTDTESRTEWRIMYRLDNDAIIIGDVFRKTTRTTPKHVIEQCQRRFSRYDNV